MLPCLRSSTKKAIRLLERRVSSSNNSLKQTHDAPEILRNQHKTDLPPDAKAPPGVPKLPLPSTGATSSSSSSSSSFFASLRSLLSFPKHEVILGVAIGTGALLYSLSGDGGENTKERSKLEAKSPFFNRITEQNKFNDMFNNKAGVINVLVGPLSCGKSRFLRELAAELELGQNPPPVIFIDSRDVSVDGPEAISKALCNEITSQHGILKLAEFPGLVQSILKQVSVSVAVKKSPVGNVSFSLGKLAEFIKKDEKDLTETINKLAILFKSMELLPRKPVIIIDEANNLMDWKEPGPSQPNLKKMLDFFVSISKQSNLAHVVLATSDYFLINWLSGKGLAAHNFVIKVLGDLSEEEAKVFFLGDGDKGPWAGIINDPSSPKPVPPGAKEKWPAIYERCGGNIGMLVQCVIAARNEGSWDVALRLVVANLLTKIQEGFDPKGFKQGDEPPDWTEAQWETVLQEIVKAPHHAVLREELAKKLGKGDGKMGKKVILSMVKYNLLALRPYSELARDLPPEVHGDRKKEVVTLPSPGYLWAAKDVLLERSDAEKSRSKKGKWIGLFYKMRLRAGTAAPHAS